MRIALTGNPNSGKTTMYNMLTGRNERVGNWAGVTVDMKEWRIRKEFIDESLGLTEELIAVDLPGAYSMSPFTSEESITSGYVKNEHPDVIINIVDSTNLSRSLFFTTQLLELGVPVVVALNKADLTNKKETKIDIDQLSEKLNCPVIATISTSSKDNNNLIDVISAAIKVAHTEQVAPYHEAEIDLTDKSLVEIEDRKRFEFVNDLVSKVETRKVFTKDKNFQDKVDAVLTNKWAGIPIFMVVMFLVFWISQVGPGVWIADLIVGWIETFQGWLDEVLINAGTNDFLRVLMTNGIIGGVGAVVGFLPLVMVMYFLIALLEDCGYMARVSVVLDPIFKRVGLSGKSVIPMVISTGCAIPGIMACRTIRNEREKKTTAMLTSFMPCGAKLPIIALFSGVFFGDSPWVGPIMYFVGILLIFLCALLVKAITGFKYRKSFFIIELPEYKAPSLKRATMSMLQRGKAYIVKAGTIILVCNAVVQVLQSFTWSLQYIDPSDSEAAVTSILHDLSLPFAYILIPVIGVLAWQLAAAAVTGFIAKENVVGTLAVCLMIGSAVSDDFELVEGGVLSFQTAFANLGVTTSAGLAYMMFTLFTPPCFAAIGAMNSEIKDKKWLWGGIGLQLAVGFTAGYLVYQFGTLFTTGSLGKGFFPGLIFILAVAGFCTWLIIHNRKQFSKEYELKK